MVHGVGFLLETLFFWSLMTEQQQQQQQQQHSVHHHHTLLVLVTGGCAVLAWLEAACAPTRSHVASFCLCLATCLQASWLMHTGVALLSQVN